MKLIGWLISCALIVGSGEAPIFAQNHDADKNSVKQTTKVVAKDTKKGAKETGRAAKKTTKKAINKGAEATKKGAGKVENKTDSKK